MSAICANCAHERVGNYCTHCGQNDRDYRRSLPPMVGQLISEAFELDGRIVRSLKLLFFKPGSLSTEFSNNRRADFISPIRLYLFASLLFFFVVSFDSVEQAPFDPSEITIDEAQNANLGQTDIAIYKTHIFTDQHAMVDEILARESGLGKDILTAAISGIVETHDPQDPPRLVERFLQTQAVKAIGSPSTTFNELFDKAPIALFFLVPAYAFLLKLVYLRQRKFYVEHLVFALHVHSLAFLVFSLDALLPEENAWAMLENVLMTGFLIYYFFALKNYYGQGMGKTLAKYVFLLVMYSVLIVPAVLLVLLTTLTLL